LLVGAYSVTVQVYQWNNISLVPGYAHHTDTFVWPLDRLKEKVPCLKFNERRGEDSRV
jgi:hypothetical protein